LRIKKKIIYAHPKIILIMFLWNSQLLFFTNSLKIVEIQPKARDHVSYFFIHISVKSDLHKIMFVNEFDKTGKIE